MTITASRHLFHTQKMARLLVSGFVVLLLSCLVLANERVSYKGYKKIAVDLKHVDVQQLRDSNSKINVLAVRGNTVDLLIDEASLNNLRALGSPHQILIDDVEAHIKAHQPKLDLKWDSVGRDSPFFDTFRQYEEISRYVDQLVANYSRVLTKFNAGVTYEGRTIFGVKLSTGGAAKPSVYVQAQVHAREWLAAPTNLFVITSFLEEYVSGSPDIVELVQGLDFYFVPIVNIDGYIYTWNSDRYWRKNRRVNSGSAAVGVDINRNWGPESTWCTSGSSTLPSSDTYCGSAPFSESEALGTWIESLPDLRAAVDIHSYGPLILHPFQYSYSSPPNPYVGEVIRIGLELEQGIRGVHGEPFESIQGSDLYPHSGGLIDYAYFTRGAIAFTIELRGNDFVVPDSYIRLSGQEIYAGFLLLAENALFPLKK